MSVFQLHDWWSTTIATEEEFDIGAMAIGNADNSVPPADKVVVGSQAGILRIYAPQKSDYRVEDLIHEENLNVPILQVAIGRFIPNSPNTLALAVLHPRKLTVFEFSPQVSQSGKPAAYYTLTKLYEHSLGIHGQHFTAFSMIYGSFGGVVGKDMIMVQSMDGKIQFFDQSAEAFTRQIVDCLLPGSFLYLKRMDAFIASNYANRLECYRYHVLVNSQGDIGAADGRDGGSRSSKSGGASFGLTAVRSAMVEWTLNLGEQCLQILDGRFVTVGGDGQGLSMSSNNDRMTEQLLVLSERALFLIKDTGLIIQQRRLEKEPAYVLAYQGAVGQGHNFVLANRDLTLQVFIDFQLVWAVTVQSVPVQIGLGEFGNQKGLLVTLDDAGKLNIGYLGTKPPIAAIGGVKRDLDYDKLDEEHRKLLQIIRDVQSENKSEPTENMTIRVQMGKTLDRNNHEDSLGVRPPDAVVRLHSGGGLSDQLVKVTARVFLTYHGSSPAANVNVAINVPEFIYSIPSTALFTSLTGVKSTPAIIDVIFLANSLFLPTTLEYTITVTYTANANEPRLASYQSTLPFSLCCRLRIPNKVAPYKITLDTQHSPQSLLDLFSDIVQSTHDLNGGNADLGDVFDSSGGAMALGFQFWCYSTNYQTDSANLNTQLPANGNPLERTSVGIMNTTDNPNNSSLQVSNGSIIVSKTGGRYRVQADSYPVLSLLVSELNKRLTIKLRELNSQRTESKDPSSNKFNLISFTENIPLDNYFLIIGNHFKLRQEIQTYVSQLNDISHQYRMIEKRLLSRYKDRTPSSLNGLDVLITETYQNIMSLTNIIQELYRQQNIYRIEMKGITRLVLLLSYLKYELTPYEYSLLESYFALDLLQIQSVHNFDNTQEWEEIVESTLTYLLKTMLAKNAKETAVVTTSIEILDNVDKLTKHIAMVIDRLSKGARLLKINKGSGGNGK